MMSNYLDRFITTQETVDRMNERKLEVLRLSNAPDDVIASALLEWKGGKCPVCGTEYKRVHSHNVAKVKKHRYENGKRIEYEEEKVFSDFYYYVAQCNCLETKGKEREKEKVLNDKVLAAGIPEAFKDVEFYTWDYTVDKGATDCMKKALRILEDGDFFAGLGAVLCGTPGRGKTNVAVSMLRWIIQKYPNYALRFEPMADLINRIISGGKERDYESELLMYDVILMDDIDKIHAENEWVKIKVFNILDALLRKKKHVIITTEFLTVQDFANKFSKAVESRLVGGCQFILFPEGEDYRKLKKMRELKSKQNNLGL